MNNYMDGKERASRMPSKGDYNFLFPIGKDVHGNREIESGGVKFDACINLDM